MLFDQIRINIQNISIHKDQSKINIKYLIGY